MTEKRSPDAPPPAETAPDPFEGLVRGRIVLYHPLPYEARNSDPGPWPSMVTHVGDGGKVTLNINLPVPTPIGTDPVARRAEVPYSADKQPGSWGWMYEGQNTRHKGLDP